MKPGGNDIKEARLKQFCKPEGLKVSQLAGKVVVRVIRYFKSCLFPKYVSH